MDTSKNIKNITQKHILQTYIDVFLTSFTKEIEVCIYLINFEINPILYITGIEIKLYDILNFSIFCLYIINKMKRGIWQTTYFNF